MGFHLIKMVKINSSNQCSIFQKNSKLPFRMDSSTKLTKQLLIVLLKSKNFSLLITVEIRTGVTLNSDINQKHICTWYTRAFVCVQYFYSQVFRTQLTRY